MPISLESKHQKIASFNVREPWKNGATERVKEQEEPEEQMEATPPIPIEAKTGKQQRGTDVSRSWKNIGKYHVF